MNLLINESSPYLLQHANNPVHWQAWSPEALAQAQTQNKPILVSIGYAACHWCHVMEHESFENKEVAALMNTYFVNIKIDREERPDIDAIYMDAVQAMGVHGGWPLNVFLMPDGKPFYGGTYFPKANWMKLLQSVADGFLNSQDKLQESADKFALHISQSELIKYNLKEEIAIFEKEDFEKIFQKLSHHFDYEWGGFDRAPKFPMPCIYEYLKWDTSSETSLHLKLSLDKITLGGIYDQIGGGFARYSVDERWFCPHFEKMLYDNAQLLEIYAQTARLFRNHPIVSFRESATLYQETINETVQWLHAEMLNQEGAFYSAIDADSEGIEGKYYTWQSSEIEQILGDKSADFKEAYQITEKGNWEENNILWKKDVLLNSSFKNEINLLKQHRQQRIRPTTDDKILTSWNAMAISGLVESYHATFENEFIEIATKNADFIVEKLYSKPTLFHTYKNGKAKILGFLDDYAHVIKAFIKLYQATFEEKYLEIAEQMSNYVLENFYDYDEQMFFYTDKNAEKLIARKKEIFDNVIPASNSVMAHNLYILGKILDRNDFENLALSMLGKIKKLIVTNPDY
ncbi:MAG: thioredoxin domain-containing protein, partial [Pseudarcicella sp.]|nr:thioredoxin domain-containing protein [Pseudarcicella sp.]